MKSGCKHWLVCRYPGNDISLALISSDAIQGYRMHFFLDSAKGGYALPEI